GGLPRRTGGAGRGAWPRGHGNRSPRGGRAAPPPCARAPGPRAPPAIRRPVPVRSPAAPSSRGAAADRASVDRLPLLQRAERGVVGQIGVERGDRDVPRPHGRVIGVLGGVPRGGPGAVPEVAAPPRIPPLD